MLPPSEARTPRLVTSVMSGAVTWTTSAPARPQTASLATSVTTASPSLPGGSTGSARCTSNRSCAIDQTAWWRLHLGDRDPRGGALGRIIQHRRCTPGVLCGEPGDLLVHRGQGAHFAPHGLCFPGGEPLRPGGFGGAGLPGDGAAGLALGAPGVLPGLLVQQPQRPPARRLAVLVRVFLREPFQLAGDGDGAGAEQVHHVLADPADLGAVAVGPRHHRVPERGQPGLHPPVGDRGDAEPLVVQGAGVQGPPFAVGAVGALDPVPDRDVHVQLRVAVAGQVVGSPRGVSPRGSHGTERDRLQSFRSSHPLRRYARIHAQCAKSSGSVAVSPRHQALNRFQVRSRLYFLRAHRIR